MAYTPTKWENSPSTNTPLNAENLNKLEKGVEDLHTALANGELKGDKGAKGDSVETAKVDTKYDAAKKETTVTVTTKVEGSAEQKKAFIVKDGKDGVDALPTADIEHQVTLGAGWSVAEGASARCVERGGVVFIFGGLTAANLDQKHIMTIPVEACPNCTRIMVGVMSGETVPLYMDMMTGEILIDPLYTPPTEMVQGVLYFNNSYILARKG